MIPHDIDIAKLVEDLADDGVAFTPTAPRDEVLAGQLADVADPGVGVVVAGPGSGADYRDVAQAVLDQSGLDTVIVRAPNAVAAVSDEASRAAIESADVHLASEPDYVIGVAAFQESVAQPAPAWEVVALGALLILVLIVIASLGAFRRSSQRA